MSSDVTTLENALSNPYDVVESFERIRRFKRTPKGKRTTQSSRTTQNSGASNGTLSVKSRKKQSSSCDDDDDDDKAEKKQKKGNFFTKTKKFVKNNKTALTLGTVASVAILLAAPLLGGNQGIYF